MRARVWFAVRSAQISRLGFFCPYFFFRARRGTDSSCDRLVILSFFLFLFLFFYFVSAELLPVLVAQYACARCGGDVHVAADGVTVCRHALSNARSKPS